MCACGCMVVVAWEQRGAFIVLFVKNIGPRRHGQRNRKQMIQSDFIPSFDLARNGGNGIGGSNGCSYDDTSRTKLVLEPAVRFLLLPPPL